MFGQRVTKYKVSAATINAINARQFANVKNIGFLIDQDSTTGWPQHNPQLDTFVSRPHSALSMLDWEPRYPQDLDGETFVGPADLAGWPMFF